MLLADETGVIFLIDDDKNSDKLNKFRKGDKVKVIGAEANKVLYRNIKGMLKYRETDLYIRKETVIKIVESRMQTKENIKQEKENRG